MARPDLGTKDDAAASEGKPKAWAEGWDAAIESMTSAFEFWREGGEP